MAWHGRLSDEMLHAMRLVVDTDRHAKGWSCEQAIQCMKDNLSMAESDIVAEVGRYIVRPGQALGYEVGDLRIPAPSDIGLDQPSGPQSPAFLSWSLRRTADR